MHIETIDERTKRVLDKIKKSAMAESFYLAGGTALAVYLGHRTSIDLDFFSKKNFSTAELKNQLSKIGEVFLVGEAEGTLHVTFDHVKVSFLRYEYDLLFSPVAFDGIFLADERDIAAMKLDAVSSRGSRKDFVDIHELLKKYSLAELIGFFEKKYSNIKYNVLHVLKSLVYFEDAENEPSPILFRETNWEDVKSSIKKAVSELSANHN
jgi:hypothetical protein